MIQLELTRRIDSSGRRFGLEPADRGMSSLVQVCGRGFRPTELEVQKVIKVMQALEERQEMMVVDSKWFSSELSSANTPTAITTTTAQRAMDDFVPAGWSRQSNWS